MGTKKNKIHKKMRRKSVKRVNKRRTLRLKSLKGGSMNILNALKLVKSKSSNQPQQSPSFNPQISLKFGNTRGLQTSIPTIPNAIPNAYFKMPQATPSFRPKQFNYRPTPQEFTPKPQVFTPPPVKNKFDPTAAKAKEEKIAGKAGKAGKY